MNKPYIGVSGVEDPSKLEELIRTFSSQRHSAPHVLAIGGIVSYKTLIDAKDRPITLTRSHIGEIFERLSELPSKDILYSLHYFTKPLGEVRTELKERARPIVENPISKQITEVIESIYEDYERKQPPFNLGVQVNVSWPEPRGINQIKANHPKLKTILQISNFDSLENRIKGYDVDYFLIDASRGEGKEFDVNEATAVYNAISRNSTATIGFAGGISPQNVMERVQNLRENLGTRNFCIDAESKLRTDDRLDLTKAEDYLKRALTRFQN